MEDKLFTVRSKYLADGLAYLGFRFYKTTNNNNEVEYTFLDTTEFRDALTQFRHMKERFRIMKK